MNTIKDITKGARLTMSSTTMDYKDTNVTSYFSKRLCQSTFAAELKKQLRTGLVVFSLGLTSTLAFAETTQPPAQAVVMTAATISYQSMKIGNIDLFYREAGDKSSPTIVLLHGFPTSSQMFRNLIPELAKTYHVIAPDFPGFGMTKTPPRASYSHSFENIANVVGSLLEKKGIDRYSMYLMDYGAPVGWRLALAHPEKVQALIIQNGNAYEEGLLDFWKPFKTYWKTNDVASRAKLAEFLNLGVTQWQYTHGQPNTALISPDAAVTDQYYMDQGDNKEVQLDLFYDYRNNVALYPKVQEYFRNYQPKTLVVWGRNDQIFPWQGAEAYRHDLKNIQIHYMDGGHFILESHGSQVAKLSQDFLSKVYKK